MFHAAANNKTVARPDVVGFPLAGHPEMSPHDVNDLIVRMAVHRANPALLHPVLNKREMVVICEHAAFKPRLGPPRVSGHRMSPVLDPAHGSLHFAPAFAKATAMAEPKPLCEPVTRAFLPSSRKASRLIVSFSSHSQEAENPRGASSQPRRRILVAHSFPVSRPNHLLVRCLQP